MSTHYGNRPTGNSRYSTLGFFSYPNFSNTTGLTWLVPANAGVDGNVFYIVRVPGGTGNIYRTTTTNYNRSFTATWNMEISGGNGADGFCIQWTSVNNVNGTGGTEDVARVNSTGTIHAIGFSHFQNRVSWYKNGTLQGSRQSQGIDLRQNLHYWLDYDHSAQTCRIFYATTTTKPANPFHTFTSFVFDSAGYYNGFGATTGGFNDNHILKYWNVSFL
jgi:hypothetical protein